MEPLELPQALQILVEKNKRFYRNLCLKYTRDSTLAEDHLQEGYRKFLECGRRFESIDDAERFICKLLVNHFIDCFRKRMLDKRLCLSAEDVPQDPVDGTPSPEKELMHGQHRVFSAQLAQGVVQKLEKLPPYQREIIYLLFLKQPPLTLREISQQKNISTSTLHSRVRIALRSLRKLSRGLVTEWENF